MAGRIKVFVGYDQREHSAWLVCKDSLTEPGVEIVPLKHKDMRRQGLFERPWRTDREGQMYDDIDQKPFSTEFSHTRFLVPTLAREGGARWAVFVDCDFLFLTPISQLIAKLERKNFGKALYCVQHDFARIQEGRKMDGVKQELYARKLWSSFMVWDLEHPAAQRPTVNEVALWPGSRLHRFDFIDDEHLGALDESWNWVPGHSSKEISPDAVHWSFGGPWMPGYEHEPYAEEWRARYRGAVAQRIRRTERLQELFQ